jgi:hypothetical protein
LQDRRASRHVITRHLASSDVTTCGTKINLRALQHRYCDRRAMSDTIRSLPARVSCSTPLSMHIARYKTAADVTLRHTMHNSKQQ